MELTEGPNCSSSVRHMSTTPSIDQLKRAIAVSEQIQKLESELASILGSSAKVSAPAKVASVAAAKPAKKTRKGLSAAGRARIAAAQKARWAKVKGDAAPAAAAPAPKAAAKSKSKGKVKRVLSPEARARIVAAVKRRWAKARKAK
jgi:hypothetical protein